MQLDTEDTDFLAALGIRDEPETITPHELAMLCGKLACELKAERIDNRRNRRAFLLATGIAAVEACVLIAAAVRWIR